MNDLQAHFLGCSAEVAEMLGFSRGYFSLVGIYGNSSPAFADHLDQTIHAASPERSVKSGPGFGTPR